MKRALAAGVAYFAVAFVLGFVLGTLRVTLLAPRMGPVAATLLELPVMLAASWVACGWAVRRWQVPTDTAARAAMGACALALLLLAETLVGVVGFGRTLSEQGRAFIATEGLMGLAAQLVFAAFPLVRPRT